MKQWYALRTKPHTEYRVETGLALRQIESYLPLIESPQAHRKRKRVPFFPGYLFMRVDLAEVAAAQWQWLPGLCRVIAFDNRPASIPDQAIELIRGRLQELNAAGGLPQHPFKPGDVVRITDGPLADMYAVFDGPTTPSERVRLLLNFMGRVNQVQVEVGMVEKAPRNVRVSAPKRPRRTRGRGRYIKSS